MHKAALEVAIFDDVVAARGETFHIPGVEVDVYAHADDAVALCEAHSYDVVFMDYAMGDEHQSGADAIRAMRQAGFTGKIVATSSDPRANAEMIGVGASEALARKVHLRSYLVHLGETHLREDQTLRKESERSEAPERPDDQTLRKGSERSEAPERPLDSDDS